MASLNIAVLGECMVELQQQPENMLKRAFGGDTLNTAVYLSRLTKNHAINVSYVTALGNDPFSQDMVDQWSSEGIDTSLILRLEDKQPGLYYIETDDTGERYFHYWRNDAAAKYLFDQDESKALLDKLHNYNAIYLSGITLAILTDNGREVMFQFLDSFRESGGKVIFDNNYRPKLWKDKATAVENYMAMLHKTDIALLTFDDDQDLYGDTDLDECIFRTTNAGVKEIVIKRGSKECLVITDDIAEYVSATKVSNVVDTTAAGDSFSGGYLAQRFTGGTAIKSAEVAHKMAGTVIQYPGAIIPAEAMPSIELD
ncbi:2-dehydro-3-deoxygluconokinase [Vibrio algarum]|uniref:Sugar kinase n=1 Tax=Vibrio algarum TaxID=3020714 RepID=A0ABT4YWT4_9VIBR|nr:sugar kinase [Vibrio sp. KJ40-1]MDB1126035.1 sugar kinase [Vibrio sp. KJ40-1]